MLKRQKQTKMRPRLTHLKICFLNNLRNFKQHQKRSSTVATVVTSDTSDLLFESNYGQFFTLNCIEKTKMKKKWTGNGPIFLKTSN